jgi:imidazolonepropionase-like amidohydrolase
MRKLMFILLALLLAGAGNAQETETFPVNGVFNRNHNYYAFTNAQIHTDYQTVIPNGTLLIRNGLIVEAGDKVSIPKGAVVYDMKGKHIYPSLIDIYTSYGMPEVKKDQGNWWMPQMESKTKGAYNWNQAIKPETDAYKLFADDSRAAEEMRKYGFGAVLSSQKDGIARGSAVFVALGEGQENALILSDRAAALYSFSKGSSTQDYPSSLVGSIALIRQTYLDAQWYKTDKNKKEYNISLEAFNNLQGLPQIFEVTDKYSVLRADKIGDEFKIQYIIKGNGTEYQRLDEIAATNAKLIIPIGFPVAYDVEDPYDAALVSLEQMKHWEMAPLNPSALESKGIQFAITTSDLKDKKDFWKNLRKAIDYGLSEKQALKALTYTPAEMLGMQNKVGSLKAGMVASFIITSSTLFDDKNIIYENWVQGNPYRINDYNVVDVRGNYDLNVADKTYILKVAGEIEKPNGSIQLNDTTKFPVSIGVTGRMITLSYNLKDDKGFIRLSGVISDSSLKWGGKGQLGDGEWIDWSARFKSHYAKDQKKDSLLAQKPQLGDIIYPFMAYGRKKDTVQDPQGIMDKLKNRYDAVLVKNVTVWTNEPEGILRNQDVYITEGKIVKIGAGITPTAGASVKEIDGTGKHLTPGIIDEHSHIAISGGVNEGTQASSAEVRMGDAINPDDINIYRQLSGGVVAAQLLHGSANPIGGQSGIIKLRWGKSPEEMKIQGADGFIKFALGENVKQANWGDFNTVRFPQTRMGVEQVYYDHFIRAKEYEARWKAWDGLAPKDKERSVMPRRDLELEALVEILNKKRFITCHSYVQSEINMLMHVADSMGFKVNTFTHILEGYKVADKMKKHGVGASSFSDWWAYKMEVKDAIPYNAAILTKMGVVTAINSDDAEMARRLNQEAAKSMKYGNLSEEEALKLVTLNPARLLHLDHRMGSIKPGKDGDIVLWTDHPLSIYAKVDKTIIDGIIYYDAEEDVKMREIMRKERARLIQKMLAEKSSGGPTQKPSPKKQKLYHCDTMDEETEAHGHDHE